MFLIPHKKWCTFGSAILLLTVSGQEVTLNPENFTVQFQKTKLNFAPGEIMEFAFKFNAPEAKKLTQQYFWAYQRTGDDEQKKRGKIPIVWGNTIRLTTSMQIPGFVRMRGQVVDATGRQIRAKSDRKARTQYFDGGVAVAIEKIRPVDNEPKDFELYWQKQKELLRQNSAPVRYQECSAPNSPVRGFVVEFPTCPGFRPMTGFLTVPVDRTRCYPAQISFQGYGCYRQKSRSTGPSDHLHLTINAHGYLLDQPKAYYKNFEQSIKHKNYRYGWSPEENGSPDTAYFRGMVLRVLRAVELIKQRPEWDQQYLMVRGGSQGGLQALWAAGLDQAVSAVWIRIPWCCDLNGRSIGRQSGWFMEFTPALGYFDAINFGKRIKCPVEIAFAGLGDYTSPPSGVAALYNILTAPKKINWIQNAGHGRPNYPPTYILQKNFPASQDFQ